MRTFNRKWIAGRKECRIFGHFIQSRLPDHDLRNRSPGDWIPLKPMKSGRGTFWLQAALFALATTALVRLTGASKSGFELEKGKRLLVADFVNSTENATPPGLDLVLKLALSQSQHTFLFSDSDARTALRQMGKDSNAALTPEVAIEICRQKNIPAVIVPKISPLRDSYLMGAQLFVNRQGVLKAVSTDTVRVRGDVEMIRAADELSAKIRKTLGEEERSLASIGRVLPPSATSQGEALTLFARALALQSRGNHEGALGMLQQAVVLNPQFALAHLKLGELMMRHGARDAAIEEIARAVEGSDSLPLKENLRARAIHSVLKAEYSEAGILFGVLENLYPEDREIQAQMADLELQERRFDLAILHYEKAVRLDSSTADSYLGLCLARLYARDSEGARRALFEAEKLEPENPRVVCTAGFVDLVDNNLRDALRSFRRVSEGPAKSRGLFLTAQANIYGGCFRSALETLQEGIDLDHLRNDRDSEAGKHICRAQVYLLLGDESNAIEECRQASPMASRAADLSRIGSIFAQTGRTSEARRVLDQINSLPRNASNRYHASILSGEIEMSSAEPQNAVAILMQAKNLPPGGGPSEPLARALFQARRYNEAESEYRLVCEQKAEMLFPRREAWFMGAWSNALYDTARCLTELHKYDDAIQYYRSYLWVLDGSDRGNQKVRLALERLRKGAARLSSQQ